MLKWETRQCACTGKSEESAVGVTSISSQNYNDHFKQHIMTGPSSADSD